MSNEIDLFNEPRILEAIEKLHASEDDAEDAVVIDGLDVALIRIRRVIDKTITFSITKGNFWIAGFGIRCYNEPNQINVTEIVSGLKSINRISPGAGIDVAYFNTDDEGLVPFDLGGFCNLCPLVMTFAPVDGSATLEMILVGKQMQVSEMLKAGEPIIDWPKAPEPEAPEPFGDPGLVETKTMHATVSVFEDVSPIRPTELWSEDSHNMPAMHGVLGTVTRRGPFALQIWVGDGSPRRLIGLRVFNAPGMFKLNALYNSFEKRVVLHGAEIDIAALGAADLYAELDMGIVSNDRPLLVELDNVTPADAAAVLNVLFVSVRPTAADAR